MSKPSIGDSPGKREDVRAMFDSIAPRYDLLNHLLSMGIDKLWRRKAVSMLAPYSPKRILDVATGTADLAIAASRLGPETIVGIDISPEMLEVGRKKVDRLGKSDVIDLRVGASENLPFEDHSFDAALVAFGVRNFEHLRDGLQEINRVLTRSAPIVVLEFSHPNRFPVKQLYEFYFKHVVPMVGKAVSKHESAYEYLPESVEAFPDGEDFLEELRATGFCDLSVSPVTFGIASIYFGIRCPASGVR